MAVACSGLTLGVPTRSLRPVGGSPGVSLKGSNEDRDPTHPVAARHSTHANPHQHFVDCWCAIFVSISSAASMASLASS